ncbi:H-NS family nucleoid-associated regulatory protein [Paraburkholderia aromaticivorans]|uniref:Histone n=1 Tax=Paraburkholderia aromaticivorans TaxID=2026199 RepID=A0A248VCI3_9BURK|nr:H-NS family nucleoid-associated regulatory protein [Paraburkholderia aromaticivorans]ASV96773.1 histone [Paraburkholderia aromaticivorans]
MATLEQIQARLKKLHAQAEALLAKKAQDAIDQIRDIMLKHGLTTADIEAKASAKRAAKGLKVSAAAGMTRAAIDKKTKAAPKYQHPKTGATWSGRGRAPAWLANVKDRSKFLIAGGVEASVATTAGTVSKAKVAVKKASKAVGATEGKGQSKGPQPALYQDPKSGASWSGRGRAPAWLAGAKDRSKFLIDDAARVGDARPAVTKAAATNAPTAKRTAAKKAVSAKAPPENAPRRSVAVLAPVTPVESSAEITSST